jgi:transcription initiation factor IIE alpha subunit
MSEEKILNRLNTSKNEVYEKFEVLYGTKIFAYASIFTSPCNDIRYREAVRSK